MKKLTAIVTACTLVGWGASGALGCGGSDASAVQAPGEDGGGSSGGSSGGDASSGGGGEGSSSGGADAGSEDGSANGAASNPGKITCGASECTVENQICCRSAAGATCIAENDDCEDGAEVECDETADCPDGQQCCLESGGGGGGGSSGGGGGGGRLRARCRNGCDRGDARLCKTDEECGGRDGGTCAEAMCRGQRFRACGGSREICN